MASQEIPEIAAPVPVTLDPTTTAVLVLDMSDAICGKVPACLESVTRVKALLEKARAAGARTIFSLGRAAEQTVLADLEPRPDDPVVRSSADKFFNTDLADRLKGITTAVVVGTAANGAVLYTSFAACARGMAVVVAEDCISTREPFATIVARYQLLNQPGLTNATNTPLQPKAVTLSRSDLVTFGRTA